MSRYLLERGPLCREWLKPGPSSDEERVSARTDGIGSFLPFGLIP